MIDPTKLGKPAEWDCDICGKGNVSEPIVVTTDAGGEIWKVECSSCGLHVPVAHISPRGVELRAKLAAASPAEDEGSAELREQLYRETTRP